MISKSRLKLMITECMDFFRDELDFGDLSPRMQEKFLELKGKCAEILEYPSVVDIEELKRRVAYELAVQNMRKK